MVQLAAADVRVTSNPAEPGQLACDICMTEIPSSECGIPEAQEYVMFFCGLECYQRWVTQRQNESPRAG